MERIDYEYFDNPGSLVSYGIYNLNKIIINGEFKDEGRSYNYDREQFDNDYKKGDFLGTYIVFMFFLF